MKRTINLSEFQEKMMAHDASDVDAELQSIIDRHINRRAQQVADQELASLNSDVKSILETMFNKADYKDRTARDSESAPTE